MRTASTCVLLLCLSLCGTYSDAFVAVALSQHNVAPTNRSSIPEGFVFGAGSAAYQPVRAESSNFNRSGFPDDFLFGASSSSYQYEGAANEGGKGLSIWDTFTHNFSGQIADGSNGDVAEDFYHRYKEDVQLMKYIGLESFKFSISWPRLLPSNFPSHGPDCCLCNFYLLVGGKLSGGVNKEGVGFYNNLINELLANGVKPFVTLFHWDLPQALQDEYGGFLSPQIVEDFRDFAELCFKEFGDRITHWTTINEPYMFSLFGYGIGISAPARCSAWESKDCLAGDSATEPYLVGHHMLLSHAEVMKLYREKYQASQKGKIGIIFPSDWYVPYTNTKTDKMAAERALDFMYGWFMSPVVYGNYPKIMRTLVAERLPKFTADQSKLVQGSFDFVGLNYYSAYYASNVRSTNRINISSLTDSHVNITTERNGKPVGTPTGSNRFFAYPKGLKELLVYTKKRYNNPTIYITENGMATANNCTTEEEIKDHKRVTFLRTHILAVQQAIKKGVNVKGYFVWSFLDNFEWSLGYTLRFGINYVDYENGLKRHIKASGIWFKKFLLK